MAANLTPQYYRAEEVYRTARTAAERLTALESMLRLIPKHKGTDRLQGELKARLKAIRSELHQAGVDQRSGRSYRFPRQGSATVVIVGAPNSGKSRLLRELTDAQPIVADYPYSTHEPMPGMLTACGVQIQLIDTPPVSESLFQPYVVDLVRTADLVLCCIDGTSQTAGEETLAVFRQFVQRKTVLADKSGFAENDLTVVKIKTRFVVTQSSAGASGQCPPDLGNFARVCVDLNNRDDIPRLHDFIFKSLDVIRIHPQRPGTQVDFSDPITLPIGGTVIELAEKVHQQIAARMKFAKIWGSSTFDGQVVGRDHILEDGDIVEFH